MVRFTREQFLARLRAQTDAGVAIVGAAAGAGLCAKCQELGGADYLVLTPSGRFRMAGAGSLGGSLSYCNANETLLAMAREILPVVKETPLVAGISAADPFTNLDDFLTELSRLGFSGVQNTASCGDWDERNAKNFVKLGIGYDKEVELIARCAAFDLLAVAECWTPEQAARMAEAGADVIIVQLGLTRGGMVGAKTCISLEDAVRRAQKLAQAAHARRPEVIVLCHGGCLDTAQQVGALLQGAAGVVGFYGESALERLPIEEAVVNNAREFKATRLRSVPATQ